MKYTRNGGGRSLAIKQVAKLGTGGQHSAIVVKGNGPQVWLGDDRLSRRTCIFLVRWVYSGKRHRFERLRVHFRSDGLNSRRRKQRRYEVAGVVK